MKNKIWLITDTHFGISGNSKLWLEIISEYFTQEFIPYLRNNVKNGDILIHCGDLFDNRQHLNIEVMNKALDIWKEISKILPIHIICGNHDIYKIHSNDINSLRIFESTPNI
ncbi:MAG: metallophosphoesterase, partial [Bacteroidia bacterium]|nr:metallophosphoesterase [Bacteroidia bacterium]